jgi:ornithine cyclodeaminase
MKYISNSEIKSLGISPMECVEWVRQSFKMKYDAQLPPKKSVHPQGIDFFTSMPCLLPAQYDTYGVKVVSRINGRKPALKSDLLLYQASTGELLALMEADWITQMRTGAVAALAIELLQKRNASIYSFIGLGSTADATMACLQAILPNNKKYIIRLKHYKEQAELFAIKWAKSNYSFSIVDSNERLLENCDVLVSAVTEMPELFCSDNTKYPEGILLVPIHTRGFQNCDLFFDHVFADDKGHVETFKYFSQFKTFNELSEVLLNKTLGRKNEKQRIIAYNVGLGLHDIWFANQIYKIINAKGLTKTDQN